MPLVPRLSAAALLLLSPLALRADFSYQETTQITGGSVIGLMKMAGVFSSQARKANQPVTSSVYVQGNRMVRVYPDRIEIVDLDKETVTNVDLAKHQYTVMTFEQMKQQLQQAQAEAKKEQASQQAKASETAQQQTAPPQNVDMNFDVHVRNTGATQQVSGMNTSESIMTLSMVATDKTTQQKGALGITDDIWAAPDIPGYDEVRAFEKRYALKLGQVLGQGGIGSMSALMAQPGASKGLQDLANEMSKLKGIPVMQVMRMGSTADGQPLPAASEAPLPATTGPSMPSAGTVAQQAATSTATSIVANRLGGLGGGLGSALGGGFGRHKKAAVADVAQGAAAGAAADAGQAVGQAAGQSMANNQNGAQSANGQPATAGTASVLIESHTTMSDFSTATIDASRFAVPAGFQQVTPQKAAQ